MTSIIQSNRERKSRIDKGLVERLNNIKKDADQNDTQPEHSRQYQQNTEHAKVYHFKRTGEIKIDLVLAGLTIVNVKTQTEYDTLMQICEASSIKWVTGEDATEDNVFPQYGSETCLNLNNRGILTCCSKEYASNEREYRGFIYTLGEFEVLYGLKSSVMQLNTWYNKNKPDRKSKG